MGYPLAHRRTLCARPLWADKFAWTPLLGDLVPFERTLAVDPSFCKATRSETHCLKCPNAWLCRLLRFFAIQGTDMAPQALKITLVPCGFSHFQHGLRSSLSILRCCLLSSRAKCRLPSECSGIFGVADTSPCACTVNVAEADSAISFRRLMEETSTASLHCKAHGRRSS